MSASESVTMARDIVFLSILVLVALLALMTFRNVRSFIKVVRRGWKNSDESVSKSSKGLGKAAPLGGGVLFGAIVALAVVLGFVRRKL